MTADFDGQRIDLAAEADFRLGGIAVLPSTRQVELGGKPETLEPRIMQVLVALARKQGHVVSRDELIHTCWDGRIVGDDALNRCVAKVRRLGETSGDFRLETIPRVGYRLWVGQNAPSAELTPASHIAPTEPGKDTRWRRFLVPGLLAAGLIAVIASGLIYWSIRNSRTLSVALPMAVAVMKFDAPTADQELQQYAAATSQALADGLTRAGQRVVPVALTMDAASGSERAAIQNAGGQLLVDGFVSRENDRVRVVARLEHARHDFTVWSSTLEGTLTEPGVLGQRLSSQIMSKLNLTGPVQLLNSDDPQDVERARTWLLVLQRSDDGDDRGAMEGTKQLLEIWRDAVPTHFMRTLETMDALPFLTPAERIVEYGAAKSAALRALELDRTKPQDSTGPLAAMARATPAYAWAQRIKELEDAIATGRTVPPTGWLADNYLQVGRVIDALEKIGSRPIPSKTPIVTRARILLALGDRTRAERDLNDGKDLWPVHPIFRLLLLESSAWLGQPDEAALRLADTPGSLSDAQRALISRFIDARRSRKANDIAAVESQCALPSSRREETTLLYCLSALTILGRRDAAFDIAGLLFPEIRPQAGEDPDTRWLAAPASSWDPTILYMPWTAPLRADPRIIPLFEHVGLLDYWRETGEWPDFCDSESASVCHLMKDG